MLTTENRRSSLVSTSVLASTLGYQGRGSVTDLLKASLSSTLVTVLSTSVLDCQINTFTRVLYAGGCEKKVLELRRRVKDMVRNRIIPP